MLSKSNNDLFFAIPYTWDNNGNASTGSARCLLNDGGNTYTYNSANRLTMVNGPSSMVSYDYNGLGDRLSQPKISSL